jgi:hypothetical protein
MLQLVELPYAVTAAVRFRPAEKQQQQQQQKQEQQGKQVRKVNITS